MKQEARAVVLMARASATRNNEGKAGPTARRAKMVFADWQAGRQIKKSGQARGHRQERQEGRLAEGPAAQGCVGWGGGIASAVQVWSPLFLARGGVRNLFLLWTVPTVCPQQSAHVQALAG